STTAPATRGRPARSHPRGLVLPAQALEQRPCLPADDHSPAYLIPSTFTTAPSTPGPQRRCRWRAARSRQPLSRTKRFLPVVTRPETSFTTALIFTTQPRTRGQPRR